MTSIKYCGCISAYQDARYGIGLRVHNSTQTDTARCTSCGRPACDKIVKMRANTELIKTNGGRPLFPGAWTCLGVA